MVLRDAVELIRASEDAAHEAVQVSEGVPPLSACVEQHIAARPRLKAMQEALRALERGDAAAGFRFARSAREYVQLRREDLRLDDRLFASAPRHANEKPSPLESVESAATRQVYDRLVEASAILDIGAPTAFPTATRTRRFGAK
jgi:hemerythrin-like domain-containing protein